ncbi:MAG: PHP domain-containing protein [Clostridia bacterium]|nr:PHP domain-containing protein [Clostridia bacterium]
MFKIDTHLHTKECSQCSHVYARDLVRAYADLGFSGICVTDHYAENYFPYFGDDIHQPGDHLNAFLKGYYLVCEAAAAYGIRVYRGAEVRFNQECGNDFMVYGYPDSLLADPLSVFQMGHEAFCKLARQSGAAVFQAHPFRAGCSPVDPSLIDGIEILNLNIYQQSYNEKAQAFAREHHLKVLGASDCHRAEGAGSAYIESDTLPADSDALAQLLLSQNFRICRREELGELPWPKDKK